VTSLSEEEILALIREALVYAAPEKAAQFERIDWSSSLSSLGVDSIGLLDASAYIEDKLSAHFPDDKLARVEHVGDFGSLIRQHLQSASHHDERRQTL
jgi:acyl carrier protein